MRCSVCQAEIRPGAEEAKRAEYRRQGGGSLKVFGEFMPDGPLVKATGQLERASHGKCYFAATKRERRGGDAVQGTRPGIYDPYGDDEDD